MADLHRVTKWAEALIALHLTPGEWTFGFDNAKKRAGQCNWNTKRITVSRYLAAGAEDEDIHQTLLHEIAHAMAGSRAGHGAKWKATAESIGYVGSRLYDSSITTANEVAPWVGTCPAGHLHYRHRRPKTVMACGRCSKRFDHANTIAWEERTITAGDRRAALNTNRVT